MEKRYKYRICPNKSQRRLLTDMFGSVRFIWNYYLALRNDIYKNKRRSVTAYDCMKYLTALKQSHE